MIDFDSYIKMGEPGGKQRAEAMKQNKNTEIPSIVYRDGMIASKEYVECLSGLKRRYKQNQLRSAVKANSELLEYQFYYQRIVIFQQAVEDLNMPV